MKITALTLFPQMFDSLNHSIIGRAFKDGKIEFAAVNIRDYSADKHGKCDDVPYGGGAGMVMTPQPIVDAIRAVDPCRTARRIYLSPKGSTLNAAKARELSGQKSLVLLCGHYEGIDQRAIDLEIDEQLSIGDYVLTGGELAAMVLIDCVGRLIEGVLSQGSAEDESFSYSRNYGKSQGVLLEYPHYTRPQCFEGIEVPDILLSGHHLNIDKWRHNQALELTKKLRPDLLTNKD